MTVTLIREPPPTRLSVHTTTGAGATGRWATDASNPEDVPSDVTFSTAMPGGFDTFSCSLARDPRRSYQDVEELADLKVRGAGGEILWEGQIQSLPDQGGSGANLSPQAAGYQALLSENSAAAMIYIDQSLENWSGPNSTRQLFLLSTGLSPGSADVATDAGGNPALAFTATGSWAADAVPAVEAWYDSGVAGPVATVYFTGTPSTWSDGTDVMMWLYSASDGATAMEFADWGPWTSGGIPLGPSAWSPGTPRRWFGWSWQGAYGAAGGTDNQNYSMFMEQLAVIGNHGLPLQRDSAGNLGVLASDVAAHALSRWVPNMGFSTGSNGSIQPSSFGIPQLTFTSATTAAEIIEATIAYEGLDWAVWEGPTYWQNPRGESAKTRNWVTRVKPAQLEDAGPDVTKIANGVIVSYTAADGTTCTVGPPGSGANVESALLADADPSSPANSAGPLGQPRKRWALITMGSSTAEGAIAVGEVSLTTRKELNQAGQATIVGMVQDDRGVWWPASVVRAGDTLSVVDARFTGPRRIVSTSYSHSTRSNTLQLDQPPDTETALLERMSAVLGPLGLS